jgi:methyl-accepting chemotaxis protein
MRRRSKRGRQAQERTSQVRANIARVDHDADATGTASVRVLASARSLAGDGRNLKTKVDEFLASVRPA